MNRVLVALPIAAVLAALVWPVSKAEGGDAPGVCEQMTAERMLTNPGLASEYEHAMQSGDADEVARVKALLDQIRAAHGCGGEVALPAAPPAPRLPPGHPPIGRGERPAAFVHFDDQAIVTI
jgi:hypothetical protein